ncbi:hypothetical protein D3C75_672440 [compost metagenome]
MFGFFIDYYVSMSFYMCLLTFDYPPHDCLNRRKVAGIELEFDPTVQKHFFELSPSAKRWRGLLLSVSKSPPPDTALFCAPKKLAPTCDTVHRVVCNGKFKAILCGTALS